jgi:thioredoxin reductase (NADPH)
MAKPVILTVDDDLEVLAAIERDLRHHYQRNYRIVKAVSGEDALEAARMLKKRAAPLALILADQRMPGMTGTELLAEVVKLHPDARKVLLTAYADTEAAIASINVVGLDHYLIKPWHPPEQKLYPVLDDLLHQWSDKARLPYEGIRVLGALWSAQSFLAKEFLSRNQVPYQWIDIDQDPPMRELVKSLTGDETSLPVVLFSDGSHLIAPSHLELAAKIGMRTSAAQPFYDVVVVGAGPAGLAVAVYGASEGLQTLLIEHRAPGGQAGTSSLIENYLGFPSGLTGEDLALRATAQARRFGAELLEAQEAVGLRRHDPYRIVQLADGSEVSCYVVVLASGMSVRMLDIPGIQPLIGVGVYYGAAQTEAARYRGCDVCIVGGANSAGQGAVFFARHARKVTIFVRGQSIRDSMSHYLVARIKATPNIEVLERVQVEAVHGDRALESLTLRKVDTSETWEMKASALFIFVGAEPQSQMVAGVVERDDKGFVVTGADLLREGKRPPGWTVDRDPLPFETSVPGVFAAGDVRAGSNRRVAAAVGEGSAAVHMIHRYLQTV